MVKTISLKQQLEDLRTTNRKLGEQFERLQQDRDRLWLENRQLCARILELEAER